MTSEVINAGEAIDAGEMASGTLSAALLESRQEPLKLKLPVENHETQLMLIANTSNWRKVAKDLIGDEPVSYSEKSKRDTLRKRPIINISSHDPEALKRVLTKAAEVE